MTTEAFERARDLAAALSTALAALHCRGHVTAVPGRAEPTFVEARRFVEMSLWMLWRPPHVMVVPCVRPGATPAALVATWDPRGVAIRQTVTDRAGFEADIVRAAETLAAQASAEELATMRNERRHGRQAPDLENMEFWPEVLAGLTPDAADDPGTPLARALAERIWPARLADLRELARALDD